MTFERFDWLPGDAGRRRGHDRNRVRFHVDAARRAGFYRRGSHAVVETASCPLLDERLDRAIAGLRGGGPRGPAEVELAVGGPRR